MLLSETKLRYTLSNGELTFLSMSEEENHTIAKEVEMKITL